MFESESLVCSGPPDEYAHRLKEALKQTERKWALHFVFAFFDHIIKMIVKFRI